MILVKKAAQNGDAESQYITAILCENGLGCEADIDEATHWYTQAAEQGHTAAQEWIEKKKGIMVKSSWSNSI